MSQSSEITTECLYQWGSQSVTQAWGDPCCPVHMDKLISSLKMVSRWCRRKRNLLELQWLELGVTRQTDRDRYIDTGQCMKVASCVFWGIDSNMKSNLSAYQCIWNQSLWKRRDSSEIGQMEKLVCEALMLGWSFSMEPAGARALSLHTLLVGHWTDLPSRAGWHSSQRALTAEGLLPAEGPVLHPRGSVHYKTLQFSLLTQL